ncbi:MAG: hypothetical protein OEU32_08795 [Acidimicrobiia bacterium]|nr:hypothetical protein [Acidimicrobiia bacterium]
MAKASSVKKVARAASAGQSRRAGDRRALGFPAAVIITVLLGIALVGFAAATRDAVAQPTLSDHWHSAYGVYDCQSESFEPPFTSTADPDGIHSHEDGLIHIHPFTSNVTGKGATLQVFFDAMGVTLEDDVMTLPGGATLAEDGATCNGEPAILQVARWDLAANIDTEDPEIFTEDLAGVRFIRDGQAFTIALLPEGADVPAPETVARLATVNPTLLDPNAADDGTGVDPDADGHSDAEG